MKRCIHPWLGVMVLLAFTSAWGQTPVSQAPQRSSFALGPDNLRSLQNSINLISGQVAFPLSAGMLPGRGGLSISVGIQYNSAGTDQNMKVSNKYSALSTLGMGWSLDIPIITIDHKFTGTVHDDDYYVSEGGVSTPLVCNNFYTNPREFATKKFSNWKIFYYPIEDKWVITRENGFKYTYKPAQYLVKSGNWIGSSSKTANQSRMAYSWALSEIENTWHEKLTFLYVFDEEAVGVAGLNHTRSFRLSKIVDAIGQSVDFVYLPKDPSEYSDLYAEHSEPDGYQEKYETSYLRQVNFKSERNTTLFSVNFEYTLLGAGEFTKRFLTKIQKSFPNGETEPATKFEYFESGDYLGYIKNITNSLGARIDYFYSKTDIASSDQRLNVAAPNTEYGQAKLFAAGDYVVVFWRKLKAAVVDGGPQPVKAAVYHWDGQWNSESLWDIPAVTLADYDKMDISLAERQFITRFYQSQTNTLLIYGARRKTYAAGTTITGSSGAWEKFDRQIVKTFEGDGNGTTGVAAQEDFVTFVARFTKYVSTWTWKYERWESTDIFLTEAQHEHFFTTGNNYIFIHNDAKGDQDVLHLFYLDGTKNWVQSNVPQDIAVRTDRADVEAHDSYWHGGNTCVVALPQLNDEYIYTWDENYTNFNRIDGFGRYPDDAGVYVNNEGMVCILPKENRSDGTAMRFDGVTWNKATFNVYSDYVPLSFGSDYLMAPFYPKPWPVQATLAGILQYDPTSNSWLTPLRALGRILENSKLNDNYGNAVQAGGDIVMINDRLERVSRVDVNEGESLPLEANDFLVGGSAIVYDPNYVVYAYSPTKSGQPTGIYIVYLENLKIKSYERLPGYTIEPTKSNGGPSIFASRNGSFITLFKIMNQKSSGLQSPITVSRLLWSDGNHQSQTVFEYSNGKVDPTGIPLFNVVKVSSGADGTDASATGYTQYYYYNGMEEQNLIDRPAIQNNGKEFLLIGSMYQSVVKDKDNRTVSYALNSFDVVPTIIADRNLVLVDSAFVIHEINQTQMLDGVTTVVKNTFHEETQLLKTQQQINSQGSGNTEDVTAYYTYWWEKYDPGKQENIISPVVQTQTVTTRSGAVSYQTSDASKWHYDSVNKMYFPISSYHWQHSGSPEFTAWNEGDIPSQDWQQMARVTSIDTNDGTVFETEGPDGTKASSIYDATHIRATAVANFASFDRIAFTSFEDPSTGNWTYSNSLVVNTDSFSGAKSFKSNGNSIYITKNLDAAQYEISYWIKGQAATLELSGGAVQQTFTEEEQNGWTLMRILFTMTNSGIVKIRVPQNAMVDDVRLKPKGANMVTTVYNSEGNAIVRTSNSLFSTRFEYDGQYRLTNLRNHKGEIVKQYQYHYRDQQ